MLRKWWAPWLLGCIALSLAVAVGVVELVQRNKSFDSVFEEQCVRRAATLQRRLNEAGAVMPLFAEHVATMPQFISHDRWSKLTGLLPVPHETLNIARVTLVRDADRAAFEAAWGHKIGQFGNTSNPAPQKDEYWRKTRLPFAFLFPACFVVRCCLLLSAFTSFFPRSAAMAPFTVRACRALVLFFAFFFCPRALPFVALPWRLCSLLSYRFFPGPAHLF